MKSKTEEKKDFSADDKLLIIKDWLDIQNGISEMLSEYIIPLGVTEDSPVIQAVIAMQESHTDFAQILLKDTGERLPWFYFENEMGVCGYRAGKGDKMKSIKTAEDLLWLIELDNET